jgi:hypothetical protein
MSSDREVPHSVGDPAKSKGGMGMVYLAEHVGLA